MTYPMPGARIGHRDARLQELLADGLTLADAKAQVTEELQLAEAARSLRQREANRARARERRLTEGTPPRSPRPSPDLPPSPGCELPASISARPSDDPDELLVALQAELIAYIRSGAMPLG